ncbi:MAG TPA: galactokinase, partial [Cellulomonadaceae bacterium]|nr:galactokinase [Cellulomonadaceae bacterium]
SSGALGARMTGGGFGGSAIALVEAGGVDRIATAIADAFGAAGLTSPVFLVADASGPADRDDD